MNRSSRQSVPSALRWVAVACAWSVWLLGVFGASSQLHGALHADAGEAGHTCAVTLFSQGVEDASGFVAIVVTPVLFPAGEMTAVSAVPATCAADLLPPGRGPPAC